MTTAPKLGDSPSDVFKSINEEYRSVKELGLLPSDRRGLCDVVSTAIAQAQEDRKDVSEAAVAAARAFHAAMSAIDGQCPTCVAKAPERTAQRKNGIDYSGDDYPRAGCTVVVNFSDDGKYSWRVYVPGDGPCHTSGHPIESYFPRPVASLGTALDAFVQGRAGPKVSSELTRVERLAEAAQPAASES